jgi:hypothetical protein
MPHLRSIVIVVATLLAASAGAHAQEATPTSGFDPTARFPVHIHAGTCDDPGDIAHDLGEGGYGLPVATDASTPDGATARQVGPESANPAIVARAAVDASLDDLAADAHVIDAHVAGGNDDTARMVCGVIGGFRAGDDLVFGLDGIDASGYAGTAWLHDNGDGTTQATLFLASPRGTGVGSAQAMPASTARETEPAADLPATTQVEGIVVKDGAFSVDELELLEGIPVVIHVVNTDDQDYRFRIRELVETAPLPANEVIVVEFTVPSGGVHAVQLLAADADEELAVAPLTVVPR